MKANLVNRKHPRALMWQSTKWSDDKNISDIEREFESSTTRLITYTLDVGWNHTNSKSVHILHPTIPGKALEMEKLSHGSRFHRWVAYQVVSDFSNSDGDIVICCRRK